MTNPTPSEASLTALAEACEKASGPDRELDCRIMALVNPERFVDREESEQYADPEYLRSANRADWRYLREIGLTSYTASLDAATKLMPKGARFYVDNGTLDEGDSHACVYQQQRYQGGSKVAVSPALALCVAALRARAAASNSGGEG